MSLLELLLVQVQTVQMICDQQLSKAENMDENLLMVGRRKDYHLQNVLKLH